MKRGAEKDIELGNGQLLLSRVPRRVRGVPKVAVHSCILRLSPRLSLGENYCNLPSRPVVKKIWIYVLFSHSRATSL